jgi:hypothetical protein
MNAKGWNDMISFLYAQIQQIVMMVRQLERRCNQMEATLNLCREINQLKLEIVEIKIELEKAKAPSTQITIQKLENKVDNLSVSTLSGILNIGIAQNQSGAVEGNLLSVGGKSLDELQSAKKAPESEEEPTEQ